MISPSVYLIVYSRTDPRSCHNTFRRLYVIASSPLRIHNPKISRPSAMLGNVDQKSSQFRPWRNNCSMDYSREKTSSTTAPVAVYLLYRFPPFPTCNNSHRYSPITPACYWFRRAERHAQTAFPCAFMSVKHVTGRRTVCS